MKIKRLIATALLALAVSFIPIPAKSQDNISVTYQVNPSYEVEIPSDTGIPFMTENISCGTIKIKKAVLEENKCILVEMNSSGNLINEDNPDDKIPFQILNEDKQFTSQKYTKAGEETKLNISIKKEDWEKALGGNYKTEIKFTVSYANKDGSTNNTSSQNEIIIPEPKTYTLVIDTMIPATNTVVIDAEHASAQYVEGNKGLSDSYPVPRFSNPQFRFTAEDGYLIKKVLLNGTDVTKEIKNDILKISGVCENQIIRIETEAIQQETEEETTMTPQETEEATKVTPQETEEATKVTPQETEEETKEQLPETKPSENETGEMTTDTAEEKNGKHFSFWWILLPLLSVGIITGITVFIIKRKKQ